MIARPSFDQVFGLAFPGRMPCGDRHMFMFNAYFDESGTHAGSHAVVVAGYLAHVDQWRGFDAEWQAALAEYGLPYFHMSDFAHSVGPYRDWPEEVRRARLSRLVGIVRRYTIAGFGVGLQMPSFETAFSERGKRIIGGPYGAAALQCILLVAGELEGKTGDPQVAYTMENGALGKGELLAAYDALRQMAGGTQAARVLSLSVMSKVNALPLQAADILAYELYKDLPNQTAAAPNDRAQREPFRMLHSITSVWKYMGESELRQLSALVNLIAASSGKDQPQ